MIQAKLKLCAGCNQMKHIWKSQGKDKYCKECWYSIEKPKSIAPISKKMKETVDQYSKLRTAYLVVNPSCKARLQGCTGQATDVHHKAGRGENHLKIATWLAVCRTCHTWIELHPKEAKELGLSETRL
jgi:hypothetical protein